MIPDFTTSWILPKDISLVLWQAQKYLSFAEEISPGGVGSEPEDSLSRCVCGGGMLLVMAVGNT